VTVFACSSPRKNEFDTSPNESKNKSDQRPENNNKGNNQIKYVHGQMNSLDLYATVGNKDGQNIPEKGGCEETKETLPPGWEKHDDEHGPYYWHIKTGVTQRELPAWQKESKTPVTATNPQQVLMGIKDNTTETYECYNHSQGIPRSKTVTEINRTDTSFK
jgi:WW domain